eukprot:CAMPEP_0113827248 /NCGR_PEP_ID=MMETSP0328-20130328/4670_1 /TAXON_ID=39455 /ORGANISM="Alexandrium minutum" /LENGTH=51 /DNA_ID=CAMNT_0000795233 /DNA_START=108 /DNA_END=259 /DNA_ORIENTATION=+ /assembly_acc=CAM_ASM_000350
MLNLSTNKAGGMYQSSYAESGFDFEAVGMYQGGYTEPSFEGNAGSGYPQAG